MERDFINKLDTETAGLKRFSAPNGFIVMFRAKRGRYWKVGEGYWKVGEGPT